MKIDREKVHNKYSGHCAYCGKEIAIKEMEIDHLKPRIAGGTDDFDNLMPACRDCNNYKYHYSLGLFRNYIEQTYTQLAATAKWRVAEQFGIFERKNNKVKFYFEKYERN
jgi:5-methylcytosine-specific restriction endonuclease McrA